MPGQFANVFHLRLLFPAGVLGLTLMLNACGEGFEGTYQDELGVTRYEFRTDGTVYMSVMGATISGDYVVQHDDLTVHGPNGRLELRLEDGKLLGPMGLVLYPIKGRE